MTRRAESGLEGDARRGPALALAGHRRWPRSRRRVLRQLRVGVRQPQDRRGRSRAAHPLATVLPAEAMTMTPAPHRTAAQAHGRARRHRDDAAARVGDPDRSDRQGRGELRRDRGARARRDDGARRSRLSRSRRSRRSARRPRSPSASRRAPDIIDADAAARRSTKILDSEANLRAIARLRPDGTRASTRRAARTGRTQGLARHRRRSAAARRAAACA